MVALIRGNPASPSLNAIPSIVSSRPETRSELFRCWTSVLTLRTKLARLKKLPSKDSSIFTVGNPAGPIVVPIGTVAAATAVAGAGVEAADDEPLAPVAPPPEDGVPVCPVEPEALPEDDCAPPEELCCEGVGAGGAEVEEAVPPSVSRLILRKFTPASFAAWLSWTSSDGTSGSAGTAFPSLTRAA